MPKITTQTSKLLPYLFQHLDAEQTVTVFHVGSALPETVDFFSNYRCKLYFIDVFSALPIVSDEEAGSTPAQQFQELLHVPADTVFDVCLFWDLFNFLDAESIKALLAVLHPHLRKGSLAHAFSVHNRNAPQQNNFYGIQQIDALSVRGRQTPPPCYAPHSQRELTAVLDGFHVERSVLLPDSRLELLLLKL
ncbi:Uncharacterised protein [Halioglobus japonicus]|nr:Uncharacterised protein [Halioglobus japonicus]